MRTDASNASGPGDHQPAQAAGCAEGFTAEDIAVTFDTKVTRSGGFVLSDNTWYRGVTYATHPEMEYGMVKLASVPPGLDPVEWPTVHLLDRIADRGGLRPRTVFATVGYGVVPLFRGAPGFIPSPGRLFTTSRYKGLTQPYLKLNENTELEGNGGSCFGDSGAPRFVNGTNLAVAFTSGGGDPICRAGSDNIRLDIPEARAFFDDYLELP